MPEPQLEERRFRLQGFLTALAFAFLGVGGMAFGLALDAGPAAGVAGFCLPVGSLAVYLATRRPPMDPPAPKRES